MAIKKNDAEYEYQAKLVVDKLDEKIDKYVTKELIPMLLPENSSEKEANNLRKILFQVVALDVYKDKLIKTYDLFRSPDVDIKQVLIDNNVRSSELLISQYGGHDFEFSYDDAARSVERILANSKPRIKIENYLLRLGRDESRYVQKDFFEIKETPFYIKRHEQLVSEYARRYGKKASIREFREAINVRHQVKTILELRDFFHNHGSLEDVPLHSGYYEDSISGEIYANLAGFTGIQNQVSILRKELVKRQKLLDSMCFETERGVYIDLNRTKRKDLDESKEVYSLTDFRLILLEYAKGCKKIDTFLNMTRLREIAKKKEFIKENKAYDKMLPEIIKMFEAKFVNLPENTSLHQDVLHDFFVEFEQNMREYNPNKNVHNVVMRFEKAMLKQYEKLMLQYEEGTLPKELSFLLKDKQELAEKKAEEQRRIDADKSQWAVVLFSLVFAAMIALSVAEYNNEIGTGTKVPNDPRAYTETPSSEDIVVEEENVIEEEIDSNNNLILKIGAGLLLSGVAGAATYEIKRRRQINNEIKEEVLEVHEDNEILTETVSEDETQEKQPRRRRRNNTNIETNHANDKIEEQYVNKEENVTHRRRRRRPINNQETEVDL